MKRSLLVLSTAALLFGCSTDLEINAPYKDNAIVYGLLNMRDSIHFIKLNKAYLGEGDAFIYAQIPDSNEYQEGDVTYAKVFRKVNGNRVDSFPLRDTIVSGREPGTFYGPDQRMYYFRGPSYNLPQSQVEVFLEQNSDYELAIDVKGKRVSAVTPIVNDFSINPVAQSLDVPINLVTGAGGYGSFEYRWTANRDGKRYEVSYRFNYSEIRGTDTLYKSITQPLGTRVAANSTSGFEPMSVILEGELFFATIRNVVPVDPTVTKRIFTGLDFLMTVANDDFHTFLTLSEPVSGIVEDRPQFSNVENALGIFGSRYTKNVIGKKLNDATLNELLNGQYTSMLNFCSAFNSGPPYGCD